MRPLLSLFSVAFVAVSAAAQVENCSVYHDTIENIVKGSDQDQQTIKLVDIGQTARCFIYYAAGVYGGDSDQISPSVREMKAFQDLVKRFESSRTDKQAGSVGGTASSSVTAQGPVAKAISVAAEYGALTQSVNGQVVTVRGNLAGLPSALVRNNIFPYCIGSESANGYCVRSSLLSLLRRFSFGISFDATRNQSLTGTPSGNTPSSSTAQQVTFTGKKREVSGVSGRVEIWNRRDVTSKDFQKAWHDKVGAAMDKSTQELLDKAGKLGEEVMNASFYEDWRRHSLLHVRAAGRDRDKVVAALNDSLLDLVKLLAPAMPDYRQRAVDALAAYNRYFIDQDEFIDDLARKNVVAFEYSNNRPLGQTPVSNFRLIFDLPLTAQTKFVANGAVTIYDSVPMDAAANVKRFRDAQAGVELDHGLAKASIVGPATISLAGYYQYQNTAALLDVNPTNPIPGISFTGLPAGAKTVFAKTGNIWLVQAKLALTPKDSSVKIPLSVSYSNRTELIAKPTWRAQVGVAYDFDSLFSSLSKK